jgi:hypothetical protein
LVIVLSILLLVIVLSILLLVIVLSILLRFMAFDYSFDIFKHFIFFYKYLVKGYHLYSGK